MSLNADGRSIKTGMIVHLKGECSMRWLQQLETTSDQQLTVGRMGRAVGMMPMSKVSDGREGQRHESTGLGVGARPCSTGNTMTATLNS